MLPARLDTDQGGQPLAAYDYRLPPELVASAPAPRRVQARLMVLADGQPPAHSRVCQLTRWLRPGDLLVLNDTKVVPARLQARRATGGRVEVLLLSPAQPQRRLAGGEVHRVLLKGARRLSQGELLVLEGEPRAELEILELGARGRAVIRLGGNALALARQRGQTPLPPYISRPDGPSQEDARRYQTVYASQEGAVAAPTAGLHLSPALLAALHKRGVDTARITLHVGYGTFAEPDPAMLAAGRLHPEWVEVSEEACQSVAEAKARGGRVIAVGTTSARALEWRADGAGLPRPGSGWCDLLIAEGHGFKVLDGLMTNFHLPRTTLLMLVSALAGRERILAAYDQAIQQRYRFYSYGDAMLIV